MAGRIVYRVAQEDGGKKVGWLLRYRMGLSAGLVRGIKHLEEGILLDGERVFTDRVAQPGQELSAADGIAGEISENIAPEKGEVNIVYEDEAFFILDKPADLPVHPSRGHQGGTLANFLAYELEKRGAPVTFRAINRLDRGTSGLMCVAKTKHSAYKLGQALRAGSIKRTYLAVCCGTPPEEGRIDRPIGRKEGFGIMREVREDGQRAVTNYRLLEKWGEYSLVEVSLETGRTHQIRVHFAHMGHPLAGDFMYGAELPDFPGQALHSAQLAISLEGRQQLFETGLPERFLRFAPTI